MTQLAHATHHAGLSSTPRSNSTAVYDAGQVIECCVWCRRPARQCTLASCDSSPVYSGVLSRDGQWVFIEEEEEE